MAFGNIGGALAGLAQGLETIVAMRDRQAQRQNEALERALREKELTLRQADLERARSAQDFNQGLVLASNYPGQVADPATAERLRANPMTAPFVAEEMTLPAQGFVPAAEGGVMQQSLGQSPTGRAVFTTPESEKYRIALANNLARTEQARINAQARTADLQRRLETQIDLANITDARMRDYYKQLAAQFAQDYALRTYNADLNEWEATTNLALRQWAELLRQGRAQTDPFKMLLLQQLGGTPGGIATPPPQAAPPPPLITPPPPSRPGKGAQQGLDPEDPAGIGLRRQ